MRQRRLLLVAILLIAAVAIAFGSLSFAKGKPGPISKCPDRLIYCLDVWDPVICDDGKVYSNDCYARRACATGCEPYGLY